LLNELWQQSLKRDDFAIITVSVDDREHMPRLRRLLAENHVRFPVLHYLDGDNGGLFDYEVEYLGYNLLIDRQGVIVDNIWVREDFTDVIELLDSAASAVPRVALDMSETINDDGSFSANIIVSRSDHQPLEINYGGWYEYHSPDSELERICWDGENYTAKLIEFGDFGDYSLELEFAPRSDLKRFYYWAALDLPGTASLYDGDGLAIISDRDLRFDEDGCLLD